MTDEIVIKRFESGLKETGERYEHEIYGDSPVYETIAIKVEKETINKNDSDGKPYSYVQYRFKIPLNYSSCLVINENFVEFTLNEYAMKELAKQIEQVK